MTRTWILLVGLLGCGSHGVAPTPTPGPAPAGPAPVVAGSAAAPASGSGQGFAQPPPPRPADLAVTAEVSSVQLASDCPSRGADGGASDAKAMPKRTPGYAARGTRRACQQTTLQLTLAVTGVATPASIRIVEIKLIGLDGTTQLMTPRDPTRWDEAIRGYAAWDQQVGRDPVRASYALSAPQLDRLPGRGHDLFEVEVTVEAQAGAATARTVARFKGAVREPMVVT